MPHECIEVCSATAPGDSNARTSARSAQLTTAPQLHPGPRRVRKAALVTKCKLTVCASGIQSLGGSDHGPQEISDDGRRHVPGL